MSETLTNTIDALTENHGPAVPGIEQVSGDPEALQLIGGTYVPGHEGIKGRVSAFHNDPQHGLLALINWETEKDDKIFEAQKAFRLDELKEYNQQKLKTINAQIGQVAISEIMQDPEKTRDEFLEKLFAPKVEGIDKQQQEFDFSNLLGSEDNDAAGDVQKARVQTRKFEIREDDKKASTRILDGLKLDKNVRDIIAKNNPEGLFRDSDLVDLIRRSADLRYDLGNYFLASVNEKAGNPKADLILPRRISLGAEKTPNASGFEWLAGQRKLKSTEYVAYLMLAMVDGSFNTKDSDSTLDLDPEGAQHRKAAQQMLEYLSKTR